MAINNPERTIPWFEVLMVILILSAIGSSYYKYFYTKDYPYLIEAPCDTTIEQCFVRDCSNPDDCPPNGYSAYKEYYVNAGDFPTCGDNSCLTECEIGSIECEVIPCDSEQGDECEGPLGIPEEEMPIIEVPLQDSLLEIEGTTTESAAVEGPSSIEDLPTDDVL